MDTRQIRETTLATLRTLNSENLPATTTEKLAQLLGVRPATIRRGYCVDGHYLGLIPIKLVNRRLLWLLK